MNPRIRHGSRSPNGMGGGSAGYSYEGASDVNHAGTYTEHRVTRQQMATEIWVCFPGLSATVDARADRKGESISCRRHITV